MQFNNTNTLAMKDALHLQNTYNAGIQLIHLHIIQLWFNHNIFDLLILVRTEAIAF